MSVFMHLFLDEIEVVKKETLEEEEEKGDPDEDGDVFFDTTEYTTEEFNVNLESLINDFIE